MSNVNERRNLQQFEEAIAHLRNFRLWAEKKRVDPYVIRQAMIFTLEFDTKSAIGHGVKAEDLETFDQACRKMADEWVKTQKQG